MSLKSLWRLWVLDDEKRAHDYLISRNPLWLLVHPIQTPLLFLNARFESCAAHLEAILRAESGFHFAKKSLSATSDTPAGLL